MSSLKKCKDCGHEISKTADACPNCGARFTRRWNEIGPFTAKLVFGTALLIVVLTTMGS